MVIDGRRTAATEPRLHHAVHGDLLGDEHGAAPESVAAVC